jgi:hypothetical protein
MLSPPKVIPFLQHDSAAVRELALRYLSRAHDPNPATAGDVWAAIDRHGPGKFNSFFAALSNMPQTEPSLDRTLKSLQTEQEPNRRALLERVLARLHYGLLLRYRDLIEEAPQVSAELRSHVQKRVVLATVPPMELWERLMDLAERPEDPQAAEYDRLIESLARSPEFAGWAINTLNDPNIAGWSEVFCVDLLGRMRHRPAVGLIAATLKDADAEDPLALATHEALSHIGSVEVVQQLRQLFERCTPDVRSLIAETLGRIKLAQSEAALISLLGAESDLPVKTSLASALCALATTDVAALDRLAGMISAGQWDAEQENLGDQVAGLFAMVGRVTPKAASRPASVFSSSTARKSDLSWDDDRDEELRTPPGSPAPSSEAAAPAPPAAPKPLRRDAPRVGRNDPCPCGSGKKYKKCCGR